MTIAFDIDGTWDCDPCLFYDVAIKFRISGWDVVVVTGREQPQVKLQGLGIIDFPVVVSGPKFKEQAAIDAGYNVDIWIDNEPGTIQPTKILDTTSNDDEL